MKSLVTACKFLTVAGCWNAAEPALETTGRSAKYFIVVGVVLGLLLAVMNYVLAPYLPAAILSLTLVAILLAATGGRHLNGLYETFAAMAGSDRRVSEALGFAAVVLVILFKSAAAESMDEIATSSWLLTPVFARWGMLIFLYGYQPRFDESLRALAEQVNFSAVFVNTIVTLALAVYFLARKGLWIALVVSLFALSLRALFYRRYAAISQAHVGATIELCEALSLVLLASL